MLPLFVYTDQACVYLLYFIINKSARRAYNAVFGENVQFFNKKNQMNKKKILELTAGAFTLQPGSSKCGLWTMQPQAWERR